MPDPERRLVAIMFTDIVGFTATMEKNEEEGLQLVRQSHAIQKPLIEKYGGKWIKDIGDGVMSLFNSTLEAIECAVEIREQFVDKIGTSIRIGIHLGDVTFDNNDPYGDGVNIASRLESIAKPGSIYISETVYNTVKNTPINTRFVGRIKLKNVTDPLTTYEVIPKDSKHIIKPKIKLTRIMFYLMAVAVVLLSLILFMNSFNKVEVPYKYDIAIIYFENLTKDENYASAVLNLIQMDLSEDTSWVIAPRQRVFDELNRLYPDKSGPDPTIATELAKNLGTRNMMMGMVIEQKEEVIIHAEIIDTKSLEVLRSLKVQGNKNNMFELTKILSYQLINNRHPGAAIR